MRALLITNPTASNVTPARLRVVEKALEATFALDVASTRERGHATELAREGARLGAKAVLVLGGDGTVNEVVNGLLAGADATDVVLGVLPAGGTNVLARNLGLTNDCVEAAGQLIELAERGSVRRIGAGRAEVDTPSGSLRRVFVQVCGLFMNAETVRHVESSGLRPRLGDLAYVWGWLGALRAIRRPGAPQLTIEAPGGGPVEAWWATVVASDPMTYWGGRGLRTAPRASHDRGLDLVAARSMRYLRTLRWGAQALRSGRQVRHRDLVYLEDLAECTIQAKSPVPLEMDGEFLGEVTGLHVTALPRALPVFAPSGASAGRAPREGR